MKNFENIRQALKYIDSHLNEQIRYEQIADIFHFSPYYFHRMFSMIAGKTITAHIRDRRLEKACVMLADTNKSILEVCLKCGFDSPQSFSRTFKNKYGVSPKEYRNQGFTTDVISVDELIAKFEEQLEKGGKMSEDIINDIEKLTKEIELEPNNVELYSKRGEMYHALKKYEEAKNDFMTTIKIEPENALYLMNCGNTFQHLNKFDKAVEYQTKAIEIEPSNAGYYYARGISYQHLNDYVKATEDLTKAIIFDSSNALYFYARGVGYNQLGEHEKAIDEYTKAIEFDSGNAEYFYWRGIEYQWLNDYAKAIEDLTKAIELEPTAMYLYARGSSYKILNNIEKAIDDYGKSIELDSSNAWLYYHRGIAYRCNSQYSEAIQEHTKAGKLGLGIDDLGESGDMYNFYHRGLAYHSAGEYEKAISDYTKAIEFDASNSLFYIVRGCSYQWMKKYDEAIKDQTEAIKLNPSVAYYYHHRGLSYENTNRLDKAREDYAKAVELDPDNASYSESQNRIYIDITMLFGVKLIPYMESDAFKNMMQSLRNELKKAEINFPRTLLMDAPGLTESEIVLKMEGNVVCRKDFGNAAFDVFIEDIYNIIKECWLNFISHNVLPKLK